MQEFLLKYQHKYKLKVIDWMELGYYIMQKALAPEWTRKSKYGWWIIEMKIQLFV